MQYFVNPCGPDVKAAMTAGTLGFIDTPRQRNIRPAGVAWVADNGCFGKGYPGDEKWLAWLARNTADVDTCLFATAPDVVGDHAATLTRSTPWLPRIRQLGYPAAFVVQNGATVDTVPWLAFDVLFVGGTVECALHGARMQPVRTGRGASQTTWCDVCGVRIFDWKDGAAAAALVVEAKQRGLKVHVGRVNGFSRWQHFAKLGADTADGTYLKFGPRENLPNVMRWMNTPIQLELT